MGQSIYRDTARILAGVPYSLAGLVVPAAGLALPAVSLLWPSVPLALGVAAGGAVLAVTPPAASALADRQRRRLGLGAPRRGGQWRLDVVYGLTSCFVCLATALATVVWWTVGVACLAYPLYGWALPYRLPTIGTALCVLTGLLVVVALPAVVGACARAQVAYARLLLVVPSPSREVSPVPLVSSR
ncbi:sensor domain-containing protein [Thermoactinospora rubra]|uniref:sensor domain-containing protein n=1 Tax=Thermoactinospora rubra TaxID=1088767 RepID=UPI000A11338E|nr:sensor domain-containing protein [Thermoactinospora rubra]